MNNLRTITLLALGLVFAVTVHAQTQNYVPNTALNAATQNSEGAGGAISTGDRNVFVGDSAGRNNTSGSDNVHLGYRAGFYQFFTTDNTFIGSQSGVGNFDQNASGYDNTFVGARSGFNNDATDNTFVGSEAGYSNTQGFDNTFLGETAGYSNTTGDDNVFIGEDAGYNNTTADDNTFIGNQAGRSNTTGYRNTAVGAQAGYDFSTGYKNTALGDSAGTDLGAGNFNTFIGQAAGAASEHADYNTFVGYRAGFDNNRTNETNNANRNTYLGAYAGYRNREGQDNVFIGYDADFRSVGYSGNNLNVVIGASSQFGATGLNAGKSYGVLIGANGFTDKNYVTGVGFQNRITGDRSVALGAYDTITAADAISIGYDARVRAQYGISIGKDAAADSINSIAIGYQAKVTSSNEVSIGNATTAVIGGYVNWSATSDGRFKNNVEENVVGLDFIDALRPVTYNYDLITMEAFYGREIPEELKKAAFSKSQVKYSGFIAQEVEAAAKSLGYDFSGVKAPSGEKDAYALRYAEFVVPLVKATQELHQKVKDQESTIHQQQELLSKYENILEQMNSRMMVLEAKVASEHPDNYVAFRK